MEILIGLAIATVAIIGWFYGNAFICVFITLGAMLLTGLGAMLLSAGGQANLAVGQWFVGIGLVTIVVTWLPFAYRRSLTS